MLQVIVIITNSKLKYKVYYVILTGHSNWTWAHWHVEESSGLGYVIRLISSKYHISDYLAYYVHYAGAFDYKCKNGSKTIAALTIDWANVMLMLLYGHANILN